MHWYYSIAADVYDKSNSLIDHVLDGLIYSRLKNNDYVDWVSYEKKTTSLDPMNLILADLLMATATLVCREPVKQRKPERGWQIQRTGLQITVVYNEIACFRIYAIFFFFYLPHPNTNCTISDLPRTKTALQLTSIWVLTLQNGA